MRLQCSDLPTLIAESKWVRLGCGLLLKVDVINLGCGGGGGGSFSLKSLENKLNCIFLKHKYIL